jgi:anti-sigma B factor antagonist
MFEIAKRDDGRVVLSGRFDAAQQDKARAVFDTVPGGTVVDLEDLDYISSAGLGVLLKTQKRLVGSSLGGLRLVNVNQHIHEILRYAGLHQIFEIEASD